MVMTALSTQSLQLKVVAVEVVFLVLTMVNLVAVEVVLLEEIIQEELEEVVIHPLNRLPLLLFKDLAEVLDLIMPLLDHNQVVVVEAVELLVKPI